MLFHRARVAVLAGLLFANLAIWALVFQAAQPQPLTIAFLDVGQGDAIYLAAPGGNQVLIDAGGGKQILPALAAVMPFYDRSLDLVIATHPDADHLGGLPSVLETYEVSGVMDIGLSADTATYRAFLEAVDQEIREGKNVNSQNLVARAGAKINLGAGASLDLLWPVQIYPNQETNAASVVALLTYGETKALFTGDAPVAVERTLLARYPNLQADILKVGHHGSKTSTDQAFLAQVEPTYAIISGGANNRYGHPAPAVIEKLAAAGAQILRTDQTGTIVCQASRQTVACK